MLVAERGAMQVVAESSRVLLSVALLLEVLQPEELLLAELLLASAKFRQLLVLAGLSVARMLRERPASRTLLALAELRLLGALAAYYPCRFPSSSKPVAA